MTAFFMRCWKSASALLLAAGLSLALTACASLALAAGIEPQRAIVVASGFRMPWYRRTARAIANFFRFGRPALGA